jgi:hypothetical protein
MMRCSREFVGITSPQILEHLLLSNLKQSNISAKKRNVFHYHVGQPITSVKKAWQHYLPHQRDMSQQQDAQSSN